MSNLCQLWRGWIERSNVFCLDYRVDYRELLQSTASIKVFTVIDNDKDERVFPL